MLLFLFLHLLFDSFFFVRYHRLCCPAWEAEHTWIEVRREEKDVGNVGEVS